MITYSKKSTSSDKLETVLLIGNGGRENALAWAIQKNELIKKIYISPGNAGSEKINKCEKLELDFDDYEELMV